MQDMRLKIHRRGPDSEGEFLAEHVGLAHTRLSIRDLAGGGQPITRGRFTIVYSGEIYNADELKGELIRKGFSFATTSDTEVVLNGFICWGEGFVSRLNGTFAFAIWDGESLFLYRDHVGVKPLFYWLKDGFLVFASEHKALFAHPYIQPEIDINSLREVFALGPAHTPGNGVYKDVKELLPAHYAVFSPDGLRQTCYWQLESRPHEESYDATVERVRELVRDAIERQLVSDVPICSLLSGGVDSSIITAVAAKKLGVLNTFSFDFKDNDKHFCANAFQPERDRPFVEKMLAQYPLRHSFLECAEEELAQLLYPAVEAKDLPGMADIDSSLLYFCAKVAQENKVALTGECADEIFGGYPWFYREDLLNADSFPWSRSIETREMLLSREFRQELKLEEYADAAYRQALAEVPPLHGENPLEARRRQISYLNLHWFMQTLLTRMDRASMYSGLEARVPFADPRIVEYLWNVPWEMKCRGGVVKGLLRDAFKELLPTGLLMRKKSPYPKTYNPNFTRILSESLLNLLGDSTSPLAPLLDKDAVTKFVTSEQELGKPWFGQLMAGPQLMGYLLQVDWWMRL